MRAAIVIGVSAGGVSALLELLPKFPVDCKLSILIVQHMSKSSTNYFVKLLQDKSKIRVKEADEKEEIMPGTIYVAPLDYHLLVEEDFSISLSVSEKQNFSRPSIDVLFETAAYAYQKHLIGIILTGANHDGAEGMCIIQKMGGYTIIQSPDEAEFPQMPRAVMDLIEVDEVLLLDEISDFFANINERVEDIFGAG